MRDVCFFSVIFPKNLTYFNDFLLSLEHQSYKDFDLLLINDGCSDLEGYTEKYSLNVRIVDCDFGIQGNLAKVREFGIKKILEFGYLYAVFGDSDDFFSKNRIELSLNALKKYYLCFNDLTSVNSQGKIISQNIWCDRLGENIDRTFIQDKNVLGLGNSAINTRILKEIVIPANIIAIDWYLFYYIIEDYTAKFIPNTFTYYRQHSDNIIGRGLSTTKSIEHLCKVKTLHYNCFSDTPDSVLQKFVEFKLFFSFKHNQNGFIDYITGLNLSFFWWEESNFYIKYINK